MKPNVAGDTFDGVGAQELKVSSQYRNNAITIIALADGVMTVRAKADGNTVFENVLNGEIRLGESQTLTIRRTQIQAFEFTVDPEAAYTVRVKQTDADTER